MIIRELYLYRNDLEFNKNDDKIILIPDSYSQTLGYFDSIEKANDAMVDFIADYVSWHNEEGCPVETLFMKDKGHPDKIDKKYRFRELSANKKRYSLFGEELRFLTIDRILNKRLF